LYSFICFWDATSIVFVVIIIIIIIIIVVWPEKFDWNEAFFVLKSNTVYCGIIFANHIESTFKNYFMKSIKCLNIFTATEARFLPNAQTQNRPPDFRLPSNADSASPHHRRHHSLVCISWYQNLHCQNLTSFFSESHERRTHTVKRDGHWLLYYE
jgi:glucan phosphoethanolaminetransferase (alkaline phosphatase superfamily)